MSVPCPALPPGPKPEVRSQEHPHKLKSSGMSRGQNHDPLTTARHGLGFRNQQWGAFVVPRLHPFREKEKKGNTAGDYLGRDGTGCCDMEGARERESFKWEAKQTERDTSKIKRRRRSSIDKE